VIDERTQFELYYPPFEGAIEAGVASVMCSYNLVNGKHSCANENILNTDLR
jgi:beta-glucosidase